MTVLLVCMSVLRQRDTNEQFAIKSQCGQPTSCNSISSLSPTHQPRFHCSAAHSLSLRRRVRRVFLPLLMSGYRRGNGVIKTLNGNETALHPLLKTSHLAPTACPELRQGIWRYRAERWLPWKRRACFWRLKTAAFEKQVTMEPVVLLLWYTGSSTYSPIQRDMNKRKRVSSAKWGVVTVNGLMGKCVKQEEVRRKE